MNTTLCAITDKLKQLEIQKQALQNGIKYS